MGGTFFNVAGEDFPLSLPPDDSTLFEAADAGDLDGTTQTGNLAPGRTPCGGGIGAGRARSGKRIQADAFQGRFQYRALQGTGENAQSRCDRVYDQCG